MESYYLNIIKIRVMEVLYSTYRYHKAYLYAARDNRLLSLRRGVETYRDKYLLRRVRVFFKPKRALVMIPATDFRAGVPARKSENDERQAQTHPAYQTLLG